MQLQTATLKALKVQHRISGSTEFFVAELMLGSNRSSNRNLHRNIHARLKNRL